jgi:hypothetical protein
MTMNKWENLVFKFLGIPVAARLTSMLNHGAMNSRKNLCGLVMGVSM